MRLRAACLILTMLLQPVAEADAAPRKCFTPPEAEAIQTVRHGIRLRETAARCQEDGFSPEAQAVWQRIDTAVGSQFKAATDLRRSGFQREFESWADWNVSVWDGRIVRFFRHRPINRELCRNIDAMLKEVDTKGWVAFTKQATKLRDEVRIDFVVCRK
jgi:hypothetical protein